MRFDADCVESPSRSRTSAVVIAAFVGGEVVQQSKDVLAHRLIL
jgi:hypothetical protein